VIQFSVIDNGIGIAPEDLRRLFTPFVQVESSLNRHFEGTGLGLALVQKLTDLHGGSVEVESEVGKGSRFTIKLPYQQTMLAQEKRAQRSGKNCIPANSCRSSVSTESGRQSSKNLIG